MSTSGEGLALTNPTIILTKKSHELADKYYEPAEAKRDGLFDIGQAAEASGVSAR